MRLEQSGGRPPPAPAKKSRRKARAASEPLQLAALVFCIALIALCFYSLFTPGLIWDTLPSPEGEGRFSDLRSEPAGWALVVVFCLSLLIAASPILANVAGPLRRLALDGRGRLKAGGALAALVLLAAGVDVFAFDGDNANAAFGCLAIVVPSMLSLPDPVRRRVLESCAWAAATSLVIAGTFSQLRPPDDDPPVALTAALPRTSKSPKALTSRLDVRFHDCDTPATVTVNVRAAGPSDSPLSGDVRFLAGRPETAQWAETGRAGHAVDVTHRPIAGLVTRGVDSCYLRLPQLVGADADRLQRTARLDAVPVKSGKVTVSADHDAHLTVIRGAAPNQQGIPSRWTCTWRRPTDGQERPLGCRGVLALTERYHDALQTVMLLVIGALFTITVESVRGGVSPAAVAKD